MGLMHFLYFVSPDFLACKLLEPKNFLGVHETCGLLEAPNEAVAETVKTTR